MGVLDKFLDIMKLSDDDDYDDDDFFDDDYDDDYDEKPAKKSFFGRNKRIMILMKMKNMMITMSFR